MARRLALIAPSLGLALAGCPGPAATDDAGSSPDAFRAPDGATDMVDARRDPDAAMEGVDAPVTPDAFVAPDAHVEADAFVMADAGPTLPPIGDPTPRLVPASADGHDRLYGVAFAPDSSFYVVGVRSAGTAATDDWETIVGRFDATGALDTTFGTGGWFVRNVAVGTSGEITRGLAVQSDGRIVVLVTAEHPGAADVRDRDVYVLRLDTDGTLDETFGAAGVVTLDLSTGEADGTGFSADNAWNVDVDAMGRLVLAVGMKRTGSTDTDFGVARLTSSGALDTTFAGDGVYELDVAMTSASVRDVTLLADGTIAAGGYYRRDGNVLPLAYRLDTNGAPIATFGTGGVYTEAIAGLTAQMEIYSLSVQGTSFVTSGYGRNLGPEDNDLLSLRLDIATGARDLTYGTTGVATISGLDFNENVRDHDILPDGRNVFVGASRTTSTTADAAVFVLTRDGAPDTSYGTGGVMLSNLADGTVDHFWAIDVDPTGTRMAIVGIGGTTPATDDDALVYLTPAP